jgi:hypothetical protein
MNVGLKPLTRILTHSKISDISFELEPMDIDGMKENERDAFHIQKHNPGWTGARSSINKKILFINRKDWNTHGFDNYENDD